MEYSGTYLAKNGFLSSEYEEIEEGESCNGVLKDIWDNNNFSIHTKIKIYKVTVTSVLIYGHETWYCTLAPDSKFLPFENKTLRKILGIRWWERISNSRIREITGCRGRMSILGFHNGNG